MISGFATLKGDKMSKSKGNTIDPQSVLEEYGADAMRFWAAGPKLGEDLNYQEKDLITGKKTITKLWNASKFVFMNLKDYKHNKPKSLQLIDKLFLEELNKLVESSTNSFEKYEYSKAKSETEKFFWNLFTGDYLETVKKRVYQGTGDKKLSAQYTLHQSLLTILKLIAPIMPFVTEEIYQTYYKKTEKTSSIHLTQWPEAKPSTKQSNIFHTFQNILSKIRQEKSNAKKPMNSEIILTLPKQEKDKIRDLLEDLKDVTNANEIKEGKFEVEFV